MEDGSHNTYKWWSTKCVQECWMENIIEIVESPWLYTNREKRPQWDEQQPIALSQGINIINQLEHQYIDDGTRSKEYWG